MTLEPTFALTPRASYFYSATDYQASIYIYGTLLGPKYSALIATASIISTRRTSCFSRRTRLSILPSTTRASRTGKGFLLYGCSPI